MKITPGAFISAKCDSCKRQRDGQRAAREVMRDVAHSLYENLRKSLGHYKPGDWTWADRINEAESDLRTLNTAKAAFDSMTYQRCDHGVKFGKAIHMDSSRGIIFHDYRNA